MTVSGFAQELPLTNTPGLGGTPGAPSAILNSTFTEKINAAGEVTYAQFTDDNRTLTFDTTQGAQIAPPNDQSKFLVADNFQRPPTHNRALAANPYDEGWNYQSFGVWELGGSSGGTSDVIGAATVGAATPPGALPASGTATFNGAVAMTDETTFFSASLTINVDFGARTATLNSGVFQTESPLPTVYSGTGLSGTLTYQAGKNALSGTLHGQGAWASASGPATAQFYGPAAQEIGGTFVLTGGGGAQAGLAGAFGAARH